MRTTTIIRLRSSIRHYSTEAPPKRTVRVPVTRLGDVLIPSAEEIRAKAAAPLKPSYSADISYLDNASDNFLAAKLARLGRQETVQEDIPPIIKPRHGPTPEEIAALTAKRRQERIARTTEHIRNYVPVPEKSQLLRSEFAKLNEFMSPERKPNGNLSPRTPHPRGPMRGQRQAGSRRNERHQKVGFAKKPEAIQPSRRAPVSKPSTLEHQIDESVFEPGGHLPEFNGPDGPSSTLLDHFGPTFSPKAVTVVAQSGTAFRIPISNVDSFYKGNYSRYIRAAEEDYASPPDALGAVKVAERTLSHQRHYNLTARDRTLELVSQTSQPSKTITKVST